MADAVELILIRHGLPENVVSPDEQPVDPALTQQGHWQAQRMAAWLAHEPIDLIVTSAMRRARETAAPLEAATGLEADVWEDFVEVDRHSRFYGSVDWMRAERPEFFQALVDGDWDTLGWDPPDVFEARVMGAFARLTEATHSRRVALVCHGGVINLLLGRALGLERHHFFVADYCSISRVSVREDGNHQLVSVNETAHFDADRRGVLGAMTEPW